MQIISKTMDRALNAINDKCNTSPDLAKKLHVSLRVARACTGRLYMAGLLTSEIAEKRTGLKRYTRTHKVYEVSTFGSGVPKMKYEPEYAMLDAFNSLPVRAGHVPQVARFTCWRAV